MHIWLYLVFDIAKAEYIIDIVLVNICMLSLYYLIFFLILSRTLHKNYIVICKFRYNIVLNKESLYLHGDLMLLLWENRHINPYPTAFPYGNGMVLHFYQQQESSTTKTVHKVINKGLKTYV